jgi:hypothetical protein
MQAMSPSIFTRLKNHYFTSTPKIAAPKPSPEDEAKDREVFEKAITDAVCISCSFHEMLLTTTGQHRSQQRWYAARTSSAPPPFRCQGLLHAILSANTESTDFLKSVAGYLATQLQPTLKSALDFSSFEAKLLASTEQLSQRFDDSSTQTAGKVESLSSLIDISNTTGTSR